MISCSTGWCFKRGSATYRGFSKSPVSVTSLRIRPPPQWIYASRCGTMAMDQRTNHHSEGVRMASMFRFSFCKCFWQAEALEASVPCLVRLTSLDGEVEKAVCLISFCWCFGEGPALFETRPSTGVPLLERSQHTPHASYSPRKRKQNPSVPLGLHAVWAFKKKKKTDQELVIPKKGAFLLTTWSTQNHEKQRFSPSKKPGL